MKTVLPDKGKHIRLRFAIARFFGTVSGQFTIVHDHDCLNADPTG
jgi:hypothetical protein